MKIFRMMLDKKNRADADFLRMCNAEIDKLAKEGWRQLRHFFFVDELNRVVEEIVLVKG